jgi:hypothetical protein
MKRDTQLRKREIPTSCACAARVAQANRHKDAGRYVGGHFPQAEGTATLDRLYPLRLVQVPAESTVSVVTEELFFVADAVAQGFGRDAAHERYHADDCAHGEVGSAVVTVPANRLAERRVMRFTARPAGKPLLA